LFAQQAPPGRRRLSLRPDLKILAADDTLMDAMQGFNEALGVQCVYCHVPAISRATAMRAKEPPAR